MSVRARPRTLVTALLAVTMALLAAIVTSQPAVGPRVGHRPAVAQLRLLGAVGQRPPEPEHGRTPTRCAGRPGRPTRTPCGTGTASSARASPATTRRPSPTASCAAAAAPRAARYNSLDAVGAWDGQADGEQLHPHAHRRGQARRRLHAGLRHQAGLQPGHAGARLGQPRARQAAPARTATTGLYQTHVNAGNRTGRHVVYTIWQASHLGPVVLHLQRRDLRRRRHHADPTPTPTGPPRRRRPRPRRSPGRRPRRPPADATRPPPRPPRRRRPVAPVPARRPSRWSTRGTARFVGEVTVKAGSTAREQLARLDLRRHA